MLSEVNGTYGGSNLPCTIFVYERRSGEYWYVVEDSININCTSAELVEGVDVETLPDSDCIKANDHVTSCEQLEAEVDEVY